MLWITSTPVLVMPEDDVSLLLSLHGLTTVFPGLQRKTAQRCHTVLLCYSMVLLHYNRLYSTLLYSTILTILYYTILYYTILYYTILYYTILYYTILYYTILYYTILYYTILYYAILYYIIMLSYRCASPLRRYVMTPPRNGLQLELHGFTAVVFAGTFLQAPSSLANNLQHYNLVLSCSRKPCNKPDFFWPPIHTTNQHQQVFSGTVKYLVRKTPSGKGRTGCPTCRTHPPPPPPEMPRRFLEMHRLLCFLNRGSPTCLVRGCYLAGISNCWRLGGYSLPPYFGRLGFGRRVSSCI